MRPEKVFADSGIYTPSVVKIALGLIYLEKEPVLGQFQEVLDFLADRQERLDFLAPENGPFTFCIDGDGVFKGRFADSIIAKIREETDPKGIAIVNQSSENTAVIFARTFGEQAD